MGEGETPSLPRKNVAGVAGKDAPVDPTPVVEVDGGDPVKKTVAAAAVTKPKKDVAFTDVGSEEEPVEGVEETKKKWWKRKKKQAPVHLTSLTAYLAKVIESGWFSSGILFVILLNTILLTLQTTPSSQRNFGWYFSFIDNVFLGIYLFELLVKLWVLGSKFFDSGWNLFDGFIVITSFIDWMKEIALSLVTLDPKIFRLLRVFRAVRALRALRVLRTISFLKSLQIIVQTLLRSIPAMGNVVWLLLLVMYIFALIGRNMYGEVDPARFGSLDVCMFSLFQLLTLDDWFEFVGDNMEEAPSIIVYCLVYIVMETFIFINLFIAVIVSNLEQNQIEQAKHSKREFKRQQMLAELEAEDSDNEESGPEAAFHARVRNSNIEILKKGGECKRDLDYYYDRRTLSAINKKDKELLEKYLLTLPAIESKLNRHTHQQKILDRLVDLEIEVRYEKAVAEIANS
eukprot:GFYU01005348.1.p1 GENE.GFYU01005348.1~~GFYU01005348.1.p1  ORF type:complete len:457 (-),score=157.31 GFYU01005348.1:206-1576(-)